MRFRQKDGVPCQMLNLCQENRLRHQIDETPTLQYFTTCPGVVCEKKSNEYNGNQQARDE